MIMNKIYNVLFSLLLCTISVNALHVWCYECSSNEPGCGTPFNWLWHWTKVCPEDDDVCVKIIERKEAETVVTRGCLSTFQSIRTDIPADHYEGCRRAAVDVKLANYVNNTIKELDVKRDFYDSTEWCFCFLDYRCNGAFTIVPSFGLGLVAAFATFFNVFY